MTTDTTIAALSTAAVPAGVAVLRISGSRSASLLESIFRASATALASPRTLVFGTLVDPNDRSTLDTCMAVFMPGPHSFTGEDVVELHLHGSLVLVKKTLAILYALGATPAEAGEFTKRAFMNGKLDLVQAEAVGDIIEASSEAALKVAQEQLAGRLSAILDAVGEPLRDALAELEASIDFPEEDIQPESIRGITETIQKVQQRIDAILTSYAYGQVLRDGFRVLFYGKPNVGKSSLLNHFLGHERAIVTDIAGTTRDTLEEAATISGVPFVFCDTAGISETTDRVEQIGVQKARERISWADLVLFLVDSKNPDAHWQEDLAQLRTKNSTVWLVFSRSDLGSAGTLTASKLNSTQRVFSLSIHRPQELAALEQALLSEVQGRAPQDSSASAVLTNERHRNCLQKSIEALYQAEQAIQAQHPTEVVAAEIRLALTALDELIGVTNTEDILGRIFAKFCIGK